LAQPNLKAYALRDSNVSRLNRVRWGDDRNPEWC